MKVIKWLDNYFEEVLLVIMCAIMACIMMLQVIMRYVFGNSLTWSEELTRFIFIWSAFLSISYCIRKNLSVRITLVVDALPGKAKYIMLMVVDVISIILFAYLIPFANTYLQTTISNGQLSSAMQIPLWIIYCSPLIGFILSVIRSVQSLVMNFNAMQKVGKSEA
ncbi:MAG: TRAP transporter small permease [Lachnospiraceae bacterium]|nr:TRAP transporter small permease [Lachnospiraceae bacterium]